MLKVAITSTYDVPFEFEKINKLFEAGLDVLHIRKPGYSGEDMINFLNRIPAIYHSRIIIHKHYGLVSKFKLKGIHIRLSNAKGIYYRFFLVWLLRKHPDLVVSTTIDKPSMLKSSSISKFNYIIVSNLFNVHTKTKFSPAYQSRNIQQMVSHLNVPMIALGNVNQETLLIAKSCKFTGFALQSNLWENREWLVFFKSLVELDNKEDSPAKSVIHSL